MSKNFKSIMLLLGIFVGCCVVSFGSMKLLKYIRGTKQESPTPNPSPIVIIDPVTDTTDSKEDVKTILEEMLALRDCSVKFDSKSRRYSLFPEVEGNPQGGLVYKLYTDDSAEGVPVASSTEKNPNSILSVKQSENPYFLVVEDTLTHRRSAPLRVEKCKPRRVRKEEIETALNQKSWESFQKDDLIYRAISDQCTVYKSGRRMEQRGINALFVIYSTRKSNEEEGHPTRISILRINPGTEANDYRVTEINLEEN